MKEKQSSEKQQDLMFEREILVFVPSYNCAEYIVDAICGIPVALYDKICCLVIDNKSSDGTPEKVKQAIASNKFGFPVMIVENESNIGYAGSQKKAYRLAVDSGKVGKVIMLHGDGQYPPELMTGFIPYFNGDFALVNGSRNKKVFPREEQTPAITYMIIKILDFLESILSGVRCGEWHSGYVMYDVGFLKDVPLEKLSDVMHFDGEMILCAGILKRKIASIPIYKIYKDRKAFGTIAGIMHVIQVFKIILKFRLGFYRHMFSGTN
ncbi:MAG: glycosyltransferase family 2 protein [Lentisphaerae bacterium]|nr:glycosyltransferase family 2 protein [Lentisphaerota bacterium]